MPLKSLARPIADDADLYSAVLDEPATYPEPTLDKVEPAEASTSTLKRKTIDIDALAKLNTKVDKTGIVYISRIPPGMGPAKLKHLMSQYGDTDRVYLARDPKDTRKMTGHSKGKKKEKHLSHRFVEGWIEFLEKRVARSTAELLNARPIGGKASNPFADDIWTLKYLPKFKWSMLSASMAQQQAIETALLRNELSQSKKAQAGYLTQVEKARVQGRMEEKRAEKRERDGGGDSSVQAAGEGNPERKSKKQRVFKQRPQIESKEGNAALQGVLSNLFT